MIAAAPILHSRVRMAARGFTVIEVLLALGVLCLGVLGCVQVAAAAIDASSAARVQSLAVALASAKLEQLRSLRFEFDDQGQRVTDVTTNIATDPFGSDGGGLAASSAGSIDAYVHGFTDYLDGAGRWVGDGASPPPGAAFVRRWSIEPSGLASDAVVIEVAVSPVARKRTGGPSGLGVAGSTRLFTVLARTSR